MTTLTTLADSVQMALTASPSPQASGLGTASSSPWLVPLASAFVGALIGGGIAGATAWFSAKQLRKSAQEQLGHERVRLLNERFATAAELLGHEEPACQLAGIHAMVGLADDWAERRQTCIDVLCAYLRMPYPAEPAKTAPPGEGMAWQANREVRHTVIRCIRAHLQEESSRSGASWQGYNFDFTGTVFDGADFSGARLSGGNVSFASAEFSGGEVDFTSAEFTGSKVHFGGAEFSGGKVVLRWPAAWTVPPTFTPGVLATPPAGLLLPEDP